MSAPLVPAAAVGLATLYATNAVAVMPPILYVIVIVRIIMRESDTVGEAGRAGGDWRVQRSELRGYTHGRLEERHGGGRHVAACRELRDCHNLKGSQGDNSSNAAVTDNKINAETLILNAETADQDCLF